MEGNEVRESESQGVASLIHIQIGSLGCWVEDRLRRERKEAGKPVRKPLQ